MCKTGVLLGSKRRSVGGKGVAMAHMGNDASDGSYIEEFNFTNDGFVCQQHKAATGQVVPKTWILLDNQSTVVVLCNKHLLKHIHVANSE